MGILSRVFLSAAMLISAQTTAPDVALAGAPNALQRLSEIHSLSPLDVDSTWVEQKVTAMDGAPDDHFGISVAVSGNVALIGAYLAAVNGHPDQGTVYLFTKSNGVWAQIKKLTATGGAAGDFFGYSMAIDGSTAIVGAYGYGDSAGGNEDQGAAYIFTNTNGVWSETAKLTGSGGAADC